MSQTKTANFFTKVTQSAEVCTVYAKKLFKLLQKSKQPLVMYALYKDRYFYAKNLGSQVVLWRNAKVFDWDYMMLPNGSKIYRKRVDSDDVDKLFFADFWVGWNGVFCKAILSKDKKEVTLQLKKEHQEIAVSNDFKWNKKHNCWIKKVPIESCERYIFKVYNLYNGKRRIKNKTLSRKYWIELYEKLIFDIEEPVK